MNEYGKNEAFLFRAAIYTLLTLGAIVFCWPLLWMVGTSMKADKELFTRSRAVLPERPVPREASPYLDERTFSRLKGDRKDEAIALIAARLQEMDFAWPKGEDLTQTQGQVARGIYDRFTAFLSEETWSKQGDAFKSAITSQVSPDLAKEALDRVRRSVLVGSLRARSNDLREEALVSAKKAASTWKAEGAGARLVQKVVERQDGAELSYDFSKGGPVRLSQTFKLGFPLEKLYRFQFGLRSDDTWHTMKAYVEKNGELFETAKIMPLADAQWTLYTWQEPGPDDQTNKIVTWIHLNKVGSGPQYEKGAGRVKVTVEISQASALQAWWYKIRRNYVKVFEHIPFWRYTTTSVLLVVLNLIGTLFSCSIVAYSFARLRWPGRSLSFSLMLGTLMIPSQVTMIPFFLIIKKLGWYNTLYPLWACSFFANAFNVFLLYQFFKGIPTDLEDAAKIDGCSPLLTYWHIMLPLLRPSLATIAIFTFMGVWNDFMGPLIYLNDQRLYPLSLGLYALNVQAEGTSGNMSLMMAGSILMIVPVVALFFFAQRYFIQGITMTGMKG